MNFRVKGYAANPIGIVLLCVGCIAVGAIGMYIYMSTHQGGIDDGEDGLIQEETIISDVIPSETIVETETEVPTTEPITLNRDVIEIIVDGSEYKYDGNYISLEQIKGIVLNCYKQNPDINVKIVDNGASIQAYDALIAALRELDIELVESKA